MSDQSGAYVTDHRSSQALSVAEPTPPEVVAARIIAKAINGLAEAVEQLAYTTNPQKYSRKDRR